MAYLYLFYENYQIGTGIDPINIINEKKEIIKESAIAKLGRALPSMTKSQRDFEQLFNIKDNEFIDVEIQERLTLTNAIMTSFDDAASKLSILLKEGTDVVGAISEGIQIISEINKMLELGASTGKLGASAMQQLQGVQGRMFRIVSQLKYIKDNNLPTTDMKEMLSNFNKDIVNNGSGYLLELALVYSFLGCNLGALKGISHMMMAIGGDNGKELSPALKIVSAKLDPELEKAVKYIEEALKQNKNNGEGQSHADTVFYSEVDSSGNGVVGISGTWTGFQAKNYTDISSVKLRNYSLEQIDILKYYSSDFLVNIAGTLAGKQYTKFKEKIPYALNKNAWASQRTVDLYWNKIKTSTKILGLLDALGQTFGANITNKNDFYVIRSKESQMIKVIPVAEMVRKVIIGYLNNGDKIGVNDEVNRGASRENYWTINAGEFDWKRTPRERSNEAYSKVLNAILETKIQISLNFSSWF